MVSFPLHVTCIVQEMKRLVDSGALGDVVSVQAVNNVPYGGVYYHSWYRDAALTGGLFLQKSTHDIDYITPVSYTHLDVYKRQAPHRRRPCTARC